MDICSGQQKPVTNTVANCSAQQVSVYSDDGSSTDISQALFDSVHGNLARPFLAGLNDRVGYVGSLILDSAKTRTFAIDPKNPQNGSWPAIDLDAHYDLPGHDGPIAVELTLIKAGLGVAQIVSFRIANQTWFRLKSESQGVH